MFIYWLHAWLVKFRRAGAHSPGRKPVSRCSAHGLLRQRPGVFLLLCGSFNLLDWLSCIIHTFMHGCAHTVTQIGSMQSCPFNTWHWLGVASIMATSIASSLIKLLSFNPGGCQNLGSAWFLSAYQGQSWGWGSPLRWPWSLEQSCGKLLLYHPGTLSPAPFSILIEAQAGNWSYWGSESSLRRNASPHPVLQFNGKVRGLSQENSQEPKTLL